VQTDSDQLTDEQMVARLNAEGEQWKDDRQAEPIIDQTMEETSRHQIDSAMEKGMTRRDETTESIYL
jgi:hypothetical protein